MRRKSGHEGLPAWLAAALIRILGADGEWAVGDLEERERTRHSLGESSSLRLAWDVGSAVVWGFSRRIRRAAGATYLSLDELRLAARSLLRRPGYATGVVVALGLGIGTVAAAFTVVDGVVLRPLPFRESGQLVRLHRTDDRWGQDLDFSAAQVEMLSRTAAARGGMGGFSRAGRILRPGQFGEGQPRSVGFVRVTEGFLGMLGASPRLGRLFDPAEERDGSPVIVLSEELWRRVFGGDPSVVGSVVHLDEVRHTVVGVLPSGLGFPEDALLWRPLTRDERLDDDPELVVVARLPEGISRTAFESVLDVSADGARAEAPAAWQDFGADAVPLRDAVLGASVPRVLLVLLAASALVLLVALTNAAGLQLLRAMEARDDASVRIALGASVSRVVRGLLTETLLLAAAALTLGLAVAAAGLPAIRTLAPGAVPRIGSVEIDLRVAAVVGMVTFLGALVGGLPPALSAARSSIVGIRRGRPVSGGLRLRTLRTLVAVQLGLTTVLLISAGLLSVSLRRLLDVPRGFDAEHLLAVPLALSSATGELGMFQQELLERVEGIPGVTAATVSSQLPAFGTGMNLEMIGVGDLPVSPGETRPAYLHTVSPSFFETVRLPILEGRPLPADRFEGAGAAVVNQAFAQAFLGPRPWVGQRFTRGGTDVDERHEMEVVGVSADIVTAPGEAPPPLLYVSTEAVPIFKNLLVRVHTARPPNVTLERIHEEILALDPEQPVNVTEWISDVLGQYGARTRFHAHLMAVFGVLALSLAAIGVYGVAAYGASQRRAELGLRRALGARRSGVLGLVLGRALGTSLLGIAGGVAGAWGISRLLEGLLFEISPFEPVIYLAGVAGLGVVALLAGLVPAVRTVRDEDGLFRLLREG